MNSGKTALGVLAGLAIGAAFGILFAPDSGAATRKKISKKGGDYADGLTDQFNDLVDTMTTKFERLKAEANKMAKEAEAKATAMAQEGKAKADELKSGVANAANAKLNEVKADGKALMS
jgi:gas vesicle protein